MKLLKTLSIVVFISFIAIACGAGGGGNDGGSGSLEKCENSCNGSGESQMWCMMGCANAYGDADGAGDSTSYPDADGDGYDSNSDCDDSNADINPGATDICGDNIDQDCDGNDCPFTDNGNGTVTDNVTGLMWQQDDDNQRYNWYEASGTNEETYNSGTTDVCGSLNLAGYLDWLLPNNNELKTILTIIDETQSSFQTIDLTFFPNTKSSYYWSSTTHAYNSFNAWSVHFYYGNVYYYNKSDSLYVRCVRGGQ